MTAGPRHAADLPGRSFRIGVTGTRHIEPAALPRLRAQLTAILRAAAEAATRHGAHPPFRLISPLAEGTDRLVAEMALAEGFSLSCVMPFPQAEYEQDFTAAGSRAEFHALLARADARVLALDGARGDDEARSYEAVGRCVVHNSDLVIGVWDGKPGKGVGGTADTIRHAARFGPPVIWLHSTDAAAPPRWIESASDLRRPSRFPPPADCLDAYLARALHPPAPPPHVSHHSLVHRLAYRVRAAVRSVLRRTERHRATAPVTRFLAEQPSPVGAPWRLHGWLLHRLGGPAGEWHPPAEPADPVAAAWFAHYVPADRRAVEYAARYRSSYVWTFFLAAVSLIAAAIAIAVPDRPGPKALATGIEFVALGLILVLVGIDAVASWQRRAIEYRLLAELCRKQQALAPIGWVVPRAGAWASAAPEPPPEDEAPQTGETAWVAWLFSAWLRDAKLPTGTIDPARVAAASQAALHDLIDDQIGYHETRRRQSHNAGRKLVHAGEAAFFLVLVVVIVKLGLLWRGGDDTHAWLVALGLLGAILPALSAAFVGIRAYAELELLAEQSDVMLKAMRHARAQIAELDPTTPLASQELGSLLAPVTTLMLEDLEGWARLFRAKVVET